MSKRKSKYNEVRNWDGKLKKKKIDIDIDIGYQNRIACWFFGVCVNEMINKLKNK